MLFAPLVTLTIGVAIFSGLLIPSAFVRGLVCGMALVAAPAAAWIQAIQHTGTAPTMMGDQAEQWTAQQLRPLTRRGWRLVNHFSLRQDDIDHVLVGPGGAFAVETKWCGSSWQSEYGTVRMLRAVEQVKENERSLRLWHPFSSQRIPVTPVVVLWGRGVSKWPREQQVRKIDDVFVIAGPVLRDWFTRVTRSVLTAAQVEAAWLALDAQVTRRDPVEAERDPLPTSIAGWASRLASAVVSACLVVVVSGWVFESTDSLTASALSSLLLVLVAVAMRRCATSPLWLWWAWGWGATSFLLGVALAGAAVAAGA